MLLEMEMAAVARSSFGAVTVSTGATLGPVPDLLCITRSEVIYLQESTSQAFRFREFFKWSRFLECPILQGGPCWSLTHYKVFLSSPAMLFCELQAGFLTISSIAEADLIPTTGPIPRGSFSKVIPHAGDVQWKTADQPGKDVKEDNQLRRGEQWLTEG
ncbi:hypothetical protein DUI87_21690 [Hirundo rustica rustica]|uniref:Uncharacterized protein n=1 Tax=Hirundo rustica rustica TaxID=333673 RepID=A0A3M0K3R8_HIRRU|nr:hypothetical protein DUI87_21690 [Hirundo rustica rustica]